MCSLRDAAQDLAKLGVRIFGISRDDVQTLRQFHDKQQLPFPLLSDPDGSVVQKYGVAIDRLPMARRVTFVIDDEGQIRQVTEKVDVRGHGEQIAALIRDLQDR
jgi:peroxiredoxin Q/BCP